jgi:hypothetical protein
MMSDKAILSGLKKGVPAGFTERMVFSPGYIILDTTLILDTPRYHPLHFKVNKPVDDL